MQSIFPEMKKVHNFFTLFASLFKKKKNNSCDVTKGSDTFPKLAPAMTTLVHSAFVQNRRKVQQGIVFFAGRQNHVANRGLNELNEDFNSLTESLA